MEACCTQRFGSVDGLLLRSSEDSPPRRKEIVLRVPELAQLPWSGGRPLGKRLRYA
jgi:hypothetical protein